jgi:hypothetical protein
MNRLYLRLLLARCKVESGGTKNWGTIPFWFQLKHVIGGPAYHGPYSGNVVTYLFGAHSPFDSVHTSTLSIDMHGQLVQVYDHSHIGDLWMQRYTLCLSMTLCEMPLIGFCPRSD